MCLNLCVRRISIEYVGKESNLHVSPKWVGDEVLSKTSLVSHDTSTWSGPTLGLNQLNPPLRFRF